MAFKKWVVELKRGCWLADWQGDPGRTLREENATIFYFKELAQKTLSRVKKDYPRRNYTSARVRPLFET